MQKKVVIIAGVVCMLLTVLLAGCSEQGSSEKEKFVGTWKTIQSYNNSVILSTYFFYENGSYTISASYGGDTQSVSGTWEVADNKFIITSDMQTISNDYLFSNDGSVLTIIENGVVLDLIKQ